MRDVDGQPGINTPRLVADAGNGMVTSQCWKGRGTRRHSQKVQLAPGGILGCFHFNNDLRSSDNRHVASAASERCTRARSRE